MEGLNYFDIIILSIVAISCLFAFFRGFIVSFLSFGNWLISIILTYFLLAPATSFTSKFIESEIVAMGVTGVGLFISLSILFGIINYRVAYAIRSYIDGTVDRSLGVAFGLLRGTIIVSIIFYVISTVSGVFEYGDDPENPGPEFFTDARSYGILKLTTNTLISYIPENVMDSYGKTIDDIKKKSQEQIDKIDDNIEAPSIDEIKNQNLDEIKNQVNDTDKLMEFFKKGSDKARHIEESVNK